MNQEAQAILPGFTDPVHGAQSCFRTVLAAMSRPGRTMTLRGLPPSTHLNATMPAAGLAGMVAIALTLCDADTPIWLDPYLDTPAMRQHLRFHCGSPIVDEPGQTSFAFIGEAKKMPRFERFSSGTPEYPDRSATLVIAADLTAVAAERGISGPGVPPTEHPEGLPFGLGGLPAWFWDDRTMNQASYPQGVDVIFVDSSPRNTNSVCIVALPRTTSAVPPGRADSGPIKENPKCMLQ